MCNKLEILLQNTNSCNNKCKLCSAGYANGNKNSFEYLDLFTFENLLKEFKKNFGNDIDIIFGTLNEPTTDPTLMDKVYLTKLYGFGAKIISNGKLAVNKSKEGLSPDLWIISILGGVDGDHGYEYITGIKLDDTLNTIEYLYNKEGNIAVSLIIDPNDLRMCQVLIDRFGGKKDFYIMLGVFYDRIFNKQYNIDDIIKAKYILDKHFGTIYDGCAESMLFGKIKKCTGYNSITIDYDMNVHFCAEYISEEFKDSYRDAFIKIGNIKNEPFIDVASRIAIIKQYKIGRAHV